MNRTVGNRWPLGSAARMGVGAMALCIGCVMAAGGSTAFAQVQLDRFYPAAVAVGQTASVQAEGKFPNWPAQIVCDRSDVKLSPGEKAGDLQVSVDPEAPPGVAWIRIHDDSAASSWFPLLIEQATVIGESEPNQRIAEATEITGPCIVCGRLEKSGDVDTYRIAARSGQTLVVSMIANQVLRRPMDGVLQLVDGDGNVLFQADDQRGLDPQLAYPINVDGDYWIRVFAFPETPNSTIGYAGSADFVYALRVATDTAIVDHFLPIRVGAATPQADPVGWNLPEKTEIKRATVSEISPPIVYVPGALGWQWQPDAAETTPLIQEAETNGPTPTAEHVPFWFSGHLQTAGEVDRVRFPVVKGTRYRATVHSKGLGYLVDSVVRFVAPTDGRELAKNDDRARNDYDASLEYEAKEDGQVELQISDAVDGFGERHAYSVLVEPVTPSVTIELSADHFQLTAGGEVELTVTVNRLGGDDQRLQITAEDLPEGVQVTPVISEPKGDSAKSVKLKLTAAKEIQFQGEFAVAAYPVDADGNRTGAAVMAEFPLRELVRLSKFWLTVAKAKP